MTHKRFCNSYCEHGGVCILEYRHTALHDSKYCKWTDDCAIPKEDADALCRQKNPEMASWLLPLTDMIEGLIAAEEDA